MNTNTNTNTNSRAQQLDVGYEKAMARIDADVDAMVAQANLLRVARMIDARWSLEPEGTRFPAAAYRADLRAALAKIGGGK